LPPPFETTLRLSARQLDLGAGPPAADASATLRWTAEALEVTQGDMAFAGGRLGGGFAVRRQGGQAAFSMKLWDRASRFRRCCRTRASAGAPTSNSMAHPPARR
jgi:hypothetical protein